MGGACAARHGRAPPLASTAPAPRRACGWLSSRSTLPAAASGPARGSPPAAAHALRSRAHGSPHARASRTSASSFPLARRALGGGRSARGHSGAAAQRARRQTMEADGTGEQMRPLLTRVTGRMLAAGSSARARDAADEGGGAARRPLSRARPRRRRGRRARPPLCVAAWGGGRAGGAGEAGAGPAARPGGPAARQAPPPPRGVLLSSPAFSPPGARFRGSRRRSDPGKPTLSPGRRAVPPGDAAGRGQEPVTLPVCPPPASRALCFGTPPAAWTSRPPLAATVPLAADLPGAPPALLARARVPSCHRPSVERKVFLASPARYSFPARARLLWSSEWSRVRGS